MLGVKLTVSAVITGVTAILDPVSLPQTVPVFELPYSPYSLSLFKAVLYQSSAA